VTSTTVGYGEYPYRVEIALALVGPDISVTIGGGDAYHIGATALAVPRPSLADAAAPSASASVICVTAHKEDELARAAALELATEFGCRVSVSAGIHVDDATAEDITLLLKHYGAALAEAKRWIAKERTARP